MVTPLSLSGRPVFIGVAEAGGGSVTIMSGLSSSSSSSSKSTTVLLLCLFTEASAGND